MLRIKPSNNAELLASLNQEVQEWHHRNYPERFKPYNQWAIEKTFEELLESPDWLAWVAWWGERPVGYTLSLIRVQPDSAFTYQSNIWYLDQVCVTEAYRGRGIAKALMETIKTEALKRDIVLIEMNHWTKNITAKNFFTRQGFQYFNERMHLKLS